MRDRLTMPFSNWAIEPGKVEGAHAYVCRLVDDEGHNSVRVYSNWIEVNGRNVVPAEMLEVVLSLPISDERRRRLTHATAVERDGSYWLGGQRFALHDLSFSTRRWCAACLAEKAYHRSWWDIVAVRRCPYHDLELVERDIDGRPVGWWWPRFDVTKSGLELGGTRLPKVLRRGTLAAYLLMRMGYEESWTAPILDGLDAADVIDACHLVGRLVSNPRSATTPDLTSRTADIGYRALGSDRSHLVGAVSEWLSKNGETVGESYSKVFDWAYQQARALPHLPTRRMLLSVFRKAHASVLTGTSLDADSEDSVSLTALAADIGVDRRGLASLVDALGGAKRGRRQVSFDVTQIAEIRREIGALLTRKEAARMLGIPGWEIEPLVAGGHLRTVGFISGASRGVRFVRGQVDDILRTVKELPMVPGATSRKFITYCRRAGMRAGEVAVAILSGDVPVCRRNSDQPGFQGLHVAVASVQGSASSSGVALVSMAEAEAITNLNRPTLTCLVEDGRLGTARRTPKLCLLDRHVVEDFAARYRAASEFSVSLGVAVPELVRRLSQIGARPLVSSTDGPWLEAVVERAAVMAAFGLERDPSILDDEGLSVFWSALTDEAASRCPQFKFPPRLPSVGQRVWRGDRKGSLVFGFDPVVREVHYRLIGRRFLEDRGDDGRRRSMSVEGSPKPIIDLISMECNA